MDVTTQTTTDEATTAKTRPDPPRTVRQQIRDWWKEQLAGAEEFDAKVLAAKGAEALRQDPVFCAAFFEEVLTPVVYNVGIHLVSDQRGDIAAGTHRLTAKEAIAAIDARDDDRDWSRWFERDPASGKHISLFLMTKEQALAAAAARERAAQPDLRRAGLLRLAAGRLTGGQKIGDVWTEDELTVTERRIVVAAPKVSLAPLDAPRKGKVA